MTGSIYGAIITAAILLPNLLFVVFPPRDMPAQLRDGGLLINFLEHGGRILFFGFFLVTGRQPPDLDFSLLFGLTILFTGIYYLLWVRYFLSRRKFSCLFYPIVKIPVPMAIFPILALLCGSLWLKTTLSLLPLGCFAIGHLINSIVVSRQLIQNEAT